MSLAVKPVFLAGCYSYQIMCLDSLDVVHCLMLVPRRYTNVFE